MYVDPALVAALASGNVNLDVIWAALVAFVGAWLVVFLVVEGYALATGRTTLSAWIRRQLGITPPQPRRAWLAPLFAAVLLAFPVWFVPHIEGWLPW